METPSDLLIRCLQDFGDSEATVAIVVYRNADGNLTWRATQEANTSEIIGMLTCAREVILNNFVKDTKVENGE